MIETLLQAERLLLHGMVDQAETLYMRTLEADPRNAIALVGLSRVASERGDTRTAYGHARAALEIDPQNPTAQRLEARLAEVLAAAGEPVERPDWLEKIDAAPPEPMVEADSAPTEAADAADSGAVEPSAEQAVFARNPSMADHRRMEGQRHQPPAPADAPVSSGQARESTPRRPGLLRRLLGR